MTQAEILAEFRALPFEDKCEVMQRIRIEFAGSFTPEFVAKLDLQAEAMRRHPVKGKTWEKVRERLSGAHGNSAFRPAE